MSRNKQYFLVEDNNVDDRFTISMLLQQFGYNICSANTVDETMEFLNVAPPAAIIAEAGSIGSGILSRMKKDPRFSSIPVILLSASPDRSLEDRARRGEFAAFLRKPIDPEALYQIIQSAVEKTPRKNIRVATYLQAQVSTDAGSHDGYATVLSEYGMFFRTLDPLPANAKVVLGMTVKEKPLRIEAHVLYSYSFDEGPFKEPGMGLKFISIADEDRALIKEFILELIG